MDHVRRSGQRTVGAGGGVEQPELLSFVAATVDAVDQPVVSGRATDEGDFFVVVGQSVARPVQSHAPELRRASAAEVEQGLAVA